MQTFLIGLNTLLMVLSIKDFISKRQFPDMLITLLYANIIVLQLIVMLK